VYDWCYADLGDEARRTIRETLVRRTHAMFEAAAKGKIWWQRSYMQNHLWVNICGMSAVGVALFGEEEEAPYWIGLPLKKFQTSIAGLGLDGASHEGVGYWEYGAEYLLKFMHLARQRLGVDLYDQPWWRNTAAYAQYLSLPRAAWRRDLCLVDLADCPRSHWYGPEYILRALAHEFRDGHAQWLAQQVDEAKVSADQASWLNLLWFDPAIAPVPPDDLPTLRHFADMGIVSARTDWSGREALAVFKCGPFLGHKAMAEYTYDPGGGHVHPDANHFVLFAGGEWLLRDDGYRAKWTGQHNTLLVDGRGQLGEGKMWFNGPEPLAAKALPRVLRAESTSAVDRLSGEAASAYPADVGLRRFTRHLLFLKPGVLIVADEVVVDKAADLELRFHPEQTQARQEENALVVNGRTTALWVENLVPQGSTFTAENLPAADRHGTQTDRMFTLRLATHAAQWRSAVALSWAKNGGNPVRVKLEQAGDTWTFIAGDRREILDWKKAAAPAF
jgi:hypothetical protein